MNCEMCGKEAELYTANIEGTHLKVCKKCAGHGRILEKPKSQTAPRRIKKPAKKEEPEEKELTEAVTEDYAKKIRDARTKLEMTQKEFAKKINEKESLLHKMETGSFKPPIPLAKKLEKILNIKLVEQREEEKVVMPKQKKSSGPLTIGDMIKT